MKGFAQIKRIFEHTAYPGGPTRVVVQGDWLEIKGDCDVAKTSLGAKNPNHLFNSSSPFVFLDTCYTMPVALWPHDPFDKLPPSHPHKLWFDIIDRNQDVRE